MAQTQSWFFWALLSAGFAALTAIFAKVGVTGINSDLPGNVLSNKESITIRSFDLFNFKINLLLGQRFQILADFLDGFALAANQNTGFSGVNNNLNLAGETFNFNLGHASFFGV